MSVNLCLPFSREMSWQHEWTDGYRMQSKMHIMQLCALSFNLQSHWFCARSWRNMMFLLPQTLSTYLNVLAVPSSWWEMSVGTCKRTHAIMFVRKCKKLSTITSFDDQITRSKCFNIFARPWIDEVLRFTEPVFIKHLKSNLCVQKEIVAWLHLLW